MDKTEIEDFKEVLHRHGYSEDDFLISGKNLTDWDPDSIVPIRGQVTIERKSTNKKNDYNSGHNTSWVNDFEEDLKQGMFE